MVCPCQYYYVHNKNGWHGHIYQEIKLEFDNKTVCPCQYYYVHNKNGWHGHIYINCLTNTNTHILN